MQPTEEAASRRHKSFTYARRFAATVLTLAAHASASKSVAAHGQRRALQVGGGDPLAG